MGVTIYLLPGMILQVGSYFSVVIYTLRSYIYSHLRILPFNIGTFWLLHVAVISSNHNQVIKYLGKVSKWIWFWITIMLSFECLDCSSLTRSESVRVIAGKHLPQKMKAGTKNGWKNLANSHRIHTWYIYQQLRWKSTKCRSIYVDAMGKSCVRPFNYWKAAVDTPTCQLTGT